MFYPIAKPRFKLMGNNSFIFKAYGAAVDTMESFNYFGKRGKFLRQKSFSGKKCI